MTTYVKNSKEQEKDYKNLDYDLKDVKKSSQILKKKRKKPTSVALSEETILELKKIAEKRGIPYQVLMRSFILKGLDSLKESA